MLKVLGIAMMIMMVNVSSALAYVGNTRSYKFHHDYCYSVDQMREYNMYCTNSRQELINMGMVPCQRCRP